MRAAYRPPAPAVGTSSGEWPLSGVGSGTAPSLSRPVRPPRAVHVPPVLPYLSCSREPAARQYCPWRRGNLTGHERHVSRHGTSRHRDCHHGSSIEARRVDREIPIQGGSLALQKVIVSTLA